MKGMKLYPAHMVRAADSVQKVAQYMKKNDARYVFVLDKDKPVGVISLYDIVFGVVAAKKDATKTAAEDIMMSPVEYVDVSAPPELALKIMMKYRTYACLVTDKLKVKGIADYKSVFEKVMANMVESERHGA